MRCAAWEELEGELHFEPEEAEEGPHAELHGVACGFPAGPEGFGPAVAVGGGRGGLAVFAAGFYRWMIPRVNRSVTADLFYPMNRRLDREKLVGEMKRRDEEARTDRLKAELQPCWRQREGR